MTAVAETTKLSREEILDKANCLERRVAMQRKDKAALRSEVQRASGLVHRDAGAASLILTKIADPDWDPASDTATKHLYGN